MLSAQLDYQVQLAIFEHASLGAHADFTSMLCESPELVELRWPADHYDATAMIDQGAGWERPPLRYGVPAIMTLCARAEVVWQRL